MNIFTHRYALLARRELWEHRSLWLAPAIVAAVMVVLPLLGARNVGYGPFGQNLDASTPESRALLEAIPGLFGHMVMLGVAIMVGGIACIAIISYLLDCLYAERKDRSILFWKSLPVADAPTVLAKLLVALLLVPVMVLPLCLIAQPLMLAATAVRSEAVRSFLEMSSVTAGWRTLGHVAVTWFYCALWYAPVAAWLMLASVLARRLPLMHAVVPVIAVIVVEWMMFDTRHVSAFVGGRLMPWLQPDFAWNHDPRGLIVGLGSPDWSALYFSPALWLGLAAAAVMVYIVVRLRRYRDDT